MFHDNRLCTCVPLCVICTIQVHVGKFSAIIGVGGPPTVAGSAVAQHYNLNPNLGWRSRGVRVLVWLSLLGAQIKGNERLHK